MWKMTNLHTFPNTRLSQYINRVILINHGQVLVPPKVAIPLNGDTAVSQPFVQCPGNNNRSVTSRRDIHYKDITIYLHVGLSMVSQPSYNVQGSSNQGRQ